MQMAPAVCAMRLDDQHARHDRLLGEMAREMRLVDGHVLDADGRIVAVDLDDAIDHAGRDSGAAEASSSSHDVDRLQSGRSASIVSHAVPRPSCASWRSLPASPRISPA